ncbi:DUF4932 domain-containing protein [Pedobacter sp. Du54]|uniref:DUF4932 domain-containing protein n=1 Tax=Pedobacter anseongensis TaxID=3133439 RepID=UPI0030AFA426
MKKIILISLILISALITKAQEKLVVNVHPGVELFTIIQILGDKFPNPNPSTYSKEVMDYFGKYKDHPAVQKVKSFKKVFTDLTELGWTMSDFPNIKIYEPTVDLNWYKHNGKEETLSYIKLCKDFFYDTKFWDFYQAHAKQYEKWGREIRAKMAENNVIVQLQDFYKFNADVQWYICIDPLNSWGSHAITTKNINPQFSNVIVYNTGYFNGSSTVQDEPMFEYKGFDYLVWHEGSHVFLSSTFAKYKTEIEALAYLFNKEDEGMKRNGIGDWTYCLNENLVRSIVGCLYDKYKTEREFKKQVARETANDFIFVDDLVPFIRENYLNKKKYKNFQTFFPEVLKFLGKRYPAKA